MRVQRYAHLMLALLCALAYFRVWSLGFAWDDTQEIVLNRQVQEGASIAEIFTSEFYAGAERESGFYRPVVVAVRLALHGVGDGSPVPHHAANLLLHAAAVLLLFEVFRRHAANGVAFAASALFAVHPLGVEVVAANAGLKDLLAVVPGLALLLLFPAARRARGGRRWIAWMLIGVLAVLGAFGKESFAVILGVLAVQDVLLWRQGRFACLRRDGRAEENIRFGCAAPYAVVILAVSASWLCRLAVVGVGVTQLEPGDAVQNPLLVAPLAVRLLSAGRLLWKALSLAVFPYPLRVDYTYNQLPIAWQLTDLDAWLGIAVAVAGLLLLVRGLRRGAPYAMAAALFLLPWLPVAQLLPLRAQIFAERYVYWPLAGLCFAAVLAAATVSRVIAVEKARAAGAVVLLIIVATLALRTAERSRVWADTETLLRQALSDSPASVNVRAVAASHAVAEEKPKRALALVGPVFEPADPCPYTRDLVAGDPLPHLVMGQALTSLERYEEAKKYLARAVKLRPNAFTFWYAYGSSRLLAGDTAEAARLLEQGLKEAMFGRELEPDARAILIGWYGQQGRLDEARPHWDALLANDGTGVDGLRLVYDQVRAAGDFDRARRVVDRLRAAEIGSAAIRFYEIDLLVAADRVTEAALESPMRAFLEASGPVEALLQVGRGPLGRGDGDTAVTFFGVLHRLMPKSGAVLLHLGGAWLAAGDVEQAREAFERVVSSETATEQEKALAAEGLAEMG